MAMNGRAVVRKSVENVPQTKEPSGGQLTLVLATVADDIPPWLPGTYRQRDEKLRQFLPTEGVLNSAIYSVCASNAALTWELDGPPETVAVTQAMLLAANFGAGWTNFMMQVSLDLLTQDNGAFIEVIRESNSPDSPIIGIQHLDAARCVRTGDPERPVTYWDKKGRPHVMRWYQILLLAEYPSGIETANGLQYSALTRVLRMAQILRSINLYIDEKVSGTNIRAVHLVSGFNAQELTETIAQTKQANLQKGFVRYADPIIATSLDPERVISHEQIDLSSLPDNFDLDTYMRWYISDLAMGLGRDYQDFAPLPSGNLGSGAQSQVLASKSRGKGPGLFMKMISHAFNHFGIVPRNVEFRFDEPDVEREATDEAARKARAERYEIYVDIGALTGSVSLQLLQDEGDLPPEALDLMATAEESPKVEVSDEQKTAAHVAKGGEVVTNDETGERAEVDGFEGRDARFMYAEKTNDYQARLTVAARDWLRRTIEDFQELPLNSMVGAVDGRLDVLRAEMVALGESHLPRAYRLSDPNRAMTSGDLRAIEVSIDNHIAWVDESLIPFVQERLEEAIQELRQTAVA